MEPRKAPRRGVAWVGVGRACRIGSCAFSLPAVAALSLVCEFSHFSRFASSLLHFFTSSCLALLLSPSRQVPRGHLRPVQHPPEDPGTQQQLGGGGADCSGHQPGGAGPDVRRPGWGGGLSFCLWRAGGWGGAGRDGWGEEGCLGWRGGGELSAARGGKQREGGGDARRIIRCKMIRNGTLCAALRCGREGRVDCQIHCQSNAPTNKFNVPPLRSFHDHGLGSLVEVAFW